MQTLTTRLKLTLPQTVQDLYESVKGGFEAAITKRLIDCATFDSEHPIYITDTQRQHLEKLLGRNLKNSEDLVQQIHKLADLRIDDISVTLQPTLLQRLRTRCFGKPLSQFIAERTIQGLEEYVGMR